MPRTVLIAKSVYVWLHQLSQTYGRPVQTLDQIPDEELDLLPRRGFNALWLIGVWERSRASQRIKQMTGNPEAAASAYSLADYTIAADLGGETALPEPARARRRARHPPGQRHGPQPHGHRLPLGDRASRLVLSLAVSVRSRPTASRGRMWATTVASRSRSKTTTSTAAMRPWSFAGGTAATRRHALHLSRQRRHQLSLERYGAAQLPEARGARSESFRPSCTSRGCSRSSASTPP